MNACHASIGPARCIRPAHDSAGVYTKPLLHVTQFGWTFQTEFECASKHRHDSRDAAAQCNFQVAVDVGLFSELPSAAPNPLAEVRP
jgi:hypothetical protein